MGLPSRPLRVPSGLPKRAVWYSFDETVQPETAEIVGHQARTRRGRIATLQWRDMIAELPMPEAVGARAKRQSACMSVDPAVAKSEIGGALILDKAWTLLATMVCNCREGGAFHETPPCHVRHCSLLLVGRRL